MKKNKVKRQEGALARLEAQLEKGTKTEIGTKKKQIPLTKNNEKRIKKEVERLKEII